jgi:hypothetical protein
LLLTLKSTIDHRSLRDSNSETYISVTLLLKLTGNYFLPADEYGGFMHKNTLKSLCLFVSTMSARSFKRMKSSSTIVAIRLSTDSLAKLISSSKIQSPFTKLWIRVPSMNWKINPPDDSNLLHLFYRSTINCSSFLNSCA